MKKRPADAGVQTFAKIVMTLIFLWSGFFWSGVTIYNYYRLNPEYSYLSTEFLIGSSVILAGLILCWLRLYILQLPVTAVGFIVFLAPVREMIEHVKGTGVYFSPTFEVRYLPIIGLMILSAALFIGRIWQVFSKRSAEREEYNNRPSESILDKHHED